MLVSDGLRLAVALPQGLTKGQAVVVLTVEEYSHRVLSNALDLRYWTLRCRRAQPQTHLPLTCNINQTCYTIPQTLNIRDIEDAEYLALEGAGAGPRSERLSEIRAARSEMERLKLVVSWDVSDCISLVKMVWMQGGSQFSLSLALSLSPPNPPCPNLEPNHPGGSARLSPRHDLAGTDGSPGVADVVDPGLGFRVWGSGIRVQD